MWQQYLRSGKDGGTAAQHSKNNDVVMDGRDIGTFVLPDATYKFFLTASLDERAREGSGNDSKWYDRCKSEEVKKDIAYRDKNDSSRSFAPLSKAPDALEIDTTGIDPEDVVRIILDSIKNKKTVGAAK